jgi:hypothetical protein
MTDKKTAHPDRNLRNLENRPILTRIVENHVHGGVVASKNDPSGSPHRLIELTADISLYHGENTDSAFYAALDLSKNIGGQGVSRRL